MAISCQGIIINQEIKKSFNDNGFIIKQDCEYFYRGNNDNDRMTCYMDEYWEPYGIDPYAWYFLNDDIDINITCKLQAQYNKFPA